jgi:hypothetical protein
MSVLDELISEAYPICLKMNRQKKHVSFVLYKNRVVSVGRNVFKTHPLAKEYGYQFNEMHSELDAFRKIPYNFRSKKLTLVNVRYNKFGKLRMSKPCEHCAPWCREVFHEIYYTTDDGVVRMEY